MYNDDTEELQGISGVGLGEFGDDEIDAIGEAICEGWCEDPPISGYTIGEPSESAIANILRAVFQTTPTTREVGSVRENVRARMDARKAGREARKAGRGDGRRARGEFRVASRLAKTRAKQERKNAEMRQRQDRKNERAGMTPQGGDSAMFQQEEFINRGENTTEFKAMNGGYRWLRTGGRIYQPLGTFTVPANGGAVTIGGNTTGQSSKPFELIGFNFSIAQPLADAINYQETLLASLELGSPVLGVDPMFAATGFIPCSLLHNPSLVGPVARTGWVVDVNASGQFKGELRQVLNAAGNAGVLGADVRVSVGLVGNYVERA